MSRLDTDRQKELEPERISIAKESIEAYGYQVTQKDKRLEFWFKGYLVYMFPYTGWHSGKSIKDGRGLQKLLTQINPLNQQ